MKTYLDCYSCFLRHGLEAARMADLDETGQKAILDEIMAILRKMDLEATPPQLAQVIHRQIRRMSGKEDPYQQIKEQQNQMLLFPRQIAHR